MNRNWIAIGAGLLTFLLGAGMNTGTTWAAQPAQAAAPAAQSQQVCYTLPEYNAYQAAAADTNPQTKVAKLDDFVKQYPMTCMLPYAYVQYYNAYLGLKNYAQSINYADKLIALGDKVDVPGRLQALYTRAQAYYLGSAADKSLQTPDAATKARDAAKLGLDTLGMMKKPDNVADDAFAQQKKAVAAVFDTISGKTSMTLKDYPGAVDAYKALLMLNPNDAVSTFQLGVAELQLTPPDAADAFWEMARSLGIKDPNGPNAAVVRPYLRNQLVRYQQAPACDKLVDDEVNQLLMLASTSADKPATLSIPSAMDLDKARNDTANFLPALQMGGDAGKVMWLATCGLEYPDLLVKVMDAPVVDGDTITMKVYRPVAQDPTDAQKEIDAATDANMVIKIMGQPDASRVSKDDLVRFTGTLTDYTQSPFLLSWEKAKINDEDIPAEKGAAKKPPVHRAAPAKKPAA